MLWTRRSKLPGCVFLSAILSDSRLRWQIQGLARISHRKRLSFSTFTKYEYDSNGGEGVNVYVVDTGVYINHTEFEGRAFWGKTIPKNDLDIDGNGHGTHCAGTIASRKYGVAKAATITAVKVLGTNGRYVNSLTPIRTQR